VQNQPHISSSRILFKKWIHFPSHSWVGAAARGYTFDVLSRCHLKSRAEIEIKPLTHLASAMISSAGSSTHAPHPPHSLHKNFLSVLPLKEVLHLPTRDAHRVAFSQFSQSTLRLAANPELSITYDKHCHQQF
jgi:hypothetical protein